MYNLLIIDDEPLILESLYQMVLKKKKEQLYLFKATNGPEALRIFESRHIDIMMTDICMPGMDGIRLQEIVREKWPDCQVIFLTGQKEFALAKRAVTPGVISYVLKTEEDSAILSAIDMAWERLEKLYSDRARVMGLHRSLQEAIPVMKRDCVKSILYNTSQEDGIPSGLSEQLRVVNPDFQADAPFLLFLTDLSETPDTMEQEAVREILDQTVPGKYVRLSAFSEKNILCFFLQGEISVKLLREFLDIALNMCEKSGLRKPDIYIFGQPVSVKDAADAWYFLNCRRIELGVENGISVCLPDKTGTEAQAAGIACEDAIDRELLDNYLIQLDRDGWLNAVRNLFLRAGQGGEMQRISAYMETAASLLMAIRQYIPQENSFLDEAGLRRLSNYQYHENFKAACAWLTELSERYFLERERARTDARSYLIRRVNRYVEEHLADDVSLVGIGDHLGLSASYLSRLYKEVAGISLNRYIADRRISAAKRLLADETIKMQSIAEQTGLRSASYFTHYFKRYTGSTPQEYRKNLNGVRDAAAGGEERKGEEENEDETDRGGAAGHA